MCDIFRLRTVGTISGSQDLWKRTLSKLFCWNCLLSQRRELGAWQVSQVWQQGTRKTWLTSGHFKAKACGDCRVRRHRENIWRGWMIFWVIQYWILISLILKHVFRLSFAQALQCVFLIADINHQHFSQKHKIIVPSSPLYFYFDTPDVRYVSWCVHGPGLFP